MSGFSLSSLVVFLAASVAIEGVVNVTVPSTTSETSARPTSPAVKANPEKSDSVGRSLEAMRAFFQPAACAPPFEASGGLCLAFNNNSVSWRKAEALCVSAGGHLVWIKSRIEHNVIRGFVLSKGRAGYFWTGLHRPRNGSLFWTNGLSSGYRGKPFTAQELPFVSADSRDHQFDGGTFEKHLPFVCRRQSRSAGKKANLMMILEHNRIEIEDQVKVMSVFAIKKIQESIAKLAVAFNKVMVECPPPWIRYKGMCLLYIFQLRTWPEAEDLCTVQGGTLVWYDNDIEKKLVQSLTWTSQKRIYKFFWIGLHKENSGNIIWTGGHNTLSVKPKGLGKYFAVNQESGEFFYGDDSNKFSAVCRRLI